ncbi:MAG TPA: DUF5655 domain-containing protein, partial [Candidatus Nanopelagicales bacterium]
TAFLADAAHGPAVLGWVAGVVGGLGPATLRLTRSQLALRRRIGFAWLWLPGRWLRDPQADLVLSIGMPARLDSPRFKQVVEPYPGRWMHHLEVPDPALLDAEVAGWLTMAYAAAG